MKKHCYRCGAEVDNLAYAFSGGYLEGQSWVDFWKCSIGSRCFEKNATRLERLNA
jgi:hypothetical protein